MTPVEATATISGYMESRAAVSSAIRRAASSPAWPVQALAFPELAITA
jgi:hypothetical protein